MRVGFFGASREVTGSNILIEVGSKKILLDCGFFQGSKLNEERNFGVFPYDPRLIDIVVICHAHLDHVGRLPKLFKDGFRGVIYSTAPTKELANLVLLDNEKLMREEMRKNGEKPLYSVKEVEGVMGLFGVVSYGHKMEIAPGISIILETAGHILGSAIAIVEAEGKRLVYTSDLGNNPSELLDPPALILRADFLICESTYGGRIHEDIAKRHEKLNAIIDKTILENGVLMIPSFAIERTQELLHDIEHFCQSQNCALPSFYLDSPLAEKVTAVFEKYAEFLSKKVKWHKDIFGLDRIIMSKTVEDSKKIDRAPNPKIIIAGSGMLNGGRILYHLQEYIEDPKNSILIIGYQAAGTLGRRLLDGDSGIKIFGKKYMVRANVFAIGSYSAHADKTQILSWIGNIRDIRKVFLVHGESEQSLILSSAIKQKFGYEVFVPQLGEVYEI